MCQLIKGDNPFIKQILQSLHQVNHKMNRLEKKISSIASNLETMQSGFLRLDERLDWIEKKLDLTYEQNF